MKKSLRLGTRRSLLAMAQSRYVAQKLEEVHRDIEVKLVGIETMGDRLLDVSLQKVPGKDFFVSEIDKELLEKKIDLAVHSLKDLSLERPSELVIAAVPPRQHQHDIVFFHIRVLEKLAKNKPIIIGSSSPRRKSLVLAFLRKSLPRLKDNVQIVFEDLRGNVNTRLGRLFATPQSGRQLDAVVLALAGINRLWQDPQSLKELAFFFEKKDEILYQLLPLSEIPTAAAQGALAVVCRKEDVETVNLVKSIHDEASQKSAFLEREILAHYGGGCHENLGISCLYHPELGLLKIVRGLSQGQEFHSLKQENYPSLDRTKSYLVFNGMAYLQKQDKKRIYRKLSESDWQKLQKAKAIFVSHRHAVSDEILPILKNKKVYTAGTKTWFSLAQKGVWVHGSADSLGFTYLEQILQSSPLLQEEEILIITHSGALSRKKTQAVATYESEISPLPQIISQADILYWASASQFLANKDFIKKEAIHCCGCGETASVLRENGIEPFVFYSEAIFNEWIGHAQR
ncbi:MAG: hydroxymethylbilane synthase [Leptospiraceae bacterium]|nr:hydroxymethylbilane synthase [Leptospiraceae bacterium]MDW8305730.1 hydroxymethylbilane synthase [Leptospiraceae bacterium]